MAISIPFQQGQDTTLTEDEPHKDDSTDTMHRYETYLYPDPGLF